MLLYGAVRDCRTEIVPDQGCRCDRWFPLLPYGSPHLLSGNPLCPRLCRPRLCPLFGPARARKPKHSAMTLKTSPHDVDKPANEPESHIAQSALFHGSNRASYFQLAALSSATRTLLPSPIAFSKSTTIRGSRVLNRQVPPRFSSAACDFAGPQGCRVPPV